MSKNYIKVPSVTYALRGRDILNKNGYKASFAKNPNPKAKDGCGYIIYVNKNVSEAQNLLIKSGIKTVGVFDEL